MYLTLILHLLTFVVRLDRQSTRQGIQRWQNAFKLGRLKRCCLSPYTCTALRLVRSSLPLLARCMDVDLSISSPYPCQWFSPLGPALQRALKRFLCADSWRGRLDLLL